MRKTHTFPVYTHTHTHTHSRTHTHTGACACAKYIILVPIYPYPARQTTYYSGARPVFSFFARELDMNEQNTLTKEYRLITQAATLKCTGYSVFYSLWHLLHDLKH